MERVLDEIEVLLPVLGFDLLRPAGHEAGTPAVTGAKSVAVQPALTDANSPIFTFTESGTNAKAREANGEFVVLTGSLAKRQEVPSCTEALRSRRSEMVEAGVLEATPDGRFLRFTADAAFDSPSGASRVVYGGNVSGPRYWKHSVTGETYGEWRRSQIGS